MNKSQEIEILRETIAKLGPNSYCGPWLASVADEVASEIRSDFFPTPSIAATRKQCDALIFEARENAEKIVATATEKMKKEEMYHHNRIADQKKIAVERLRDIAQSLEDTI